MPRTPRLRLAAVTLLALVLGLNALSTRQTAAQSPAYTLVDLGPLAATDEATAACADFLGGNVRAINASGQVTGATAWSDRASAAFRATDGKVKPLKSGKGGGVGLDINVDGQVVGEITDARNTDPCDFSGIPSTHAVTWVAGGLTELPVGGAKSSQATAINDDGIIVGHYIVEETVTEEREGGGTSSSTSFIPQPVIWRDGEMEELPIPDGADEALGARPVDINARGQIVGQLRGLNSSDFVGSVLWDGDEAALLPDGFLADAINDDGVIVGTTGTADEGFSAVRLVDGELEALPGIPDDATQSQVYAVNADGDMVGIVGVPGEGDETVYTSVVWLDDEMIDLATLLPADAGFEPGRLVAINDAGMILGYGRTDDDYHGIVLVPEGI